MLRVLGRVRLTLVSWNDAPALAESTIGVMSDMHGNAAAVEAVLADAAGFAIDQWLILGDVVAMGPQPTRVLELLDPLPLLATIAGNTERYVLRDERPDVSFDEVGQDPSLLPRLAEIVGSFGWTKGFLASQGLLDAFDDYQQHYRCRLADGSRFLAVHASERHDDGYGITPTADPGELKRLFSQNDADVIIGGHTHHRTDRMVDGTRFLNPGSVSNPPGDDKAARYCVLHNQAAGLSVDLRSVAYDHGVVVEQIAACGIPGAEFLIRRYFS